MENSVNERVKLLRNSLGMSQQDLAHSISTTITSISRIEQGHSEPRKNTLQKIAKTCNVNISWLINGTGEMFLNGKPEPAKTIVSVETDLDNQYLIKENEFLRKENEWLKDLVTKITGNPNFLNGIELGGFYKEFLMKLGVNSFNTVSAVA